ncbi:MAG: FAD-dependent oxidoreductase [Planctomycetaceae bacterium]|nr:FAD-dependent oxidoreductase [Planctomycetaceae bacterium]
MMFSAQTFKSAVRIALIVSAVLLHHAATVDANEPQSADLVIYGGNAGGVAAAVQGTRMGKTVILIEPGNHIGGLTSGGLGATDIGNKAAIGGISREFYRRIGQYYSDPAAWKFQTAAEYRSSRQKAGEQEMWTFEPHVAELVLRQMLQEAGVRPLFQERLDLKAGVRKKGARISEIVMESGTVVRGKMFIDATYEGDLMALAGVSSTVGREANSTYNETLNGVQVQHAVHHQFKVAVDPFVVPGDPASGLLPEITGTDPGTEGAADHRVQAYCFRMCQTDVPENRIPWEKPADYSEQRYELLLRNFEAGDERIPWSAYGMPNRKTDTNNNFAFSIDHIGANYDYPQADYAMRAAIVADHLSYQQGLMWTLANHPRVPEKIRELFTTWGLSRDEFSDTGHWPHQLYIREARRMVGDYVMTQHHCQGREQVQDSAGLAAYTMDSHNVQRYARDGRVWNEGDVQVGGFPPYAVSWRALVPKFDECENLVVPVCLSASHIAYGSIRMEPVFMVLGQSAATGAALAIDSGKSVQDINYEKLRERLLADQQVLEWRN